MAKKWYELFFKPLQPLHIGTGNYGVVSPTRLFIPGQTMWGTLTCALGNYLNKSETEMNGNMNIFSKISNFYPVIVNKNKSEICLPAYKNGELHFGKISEKEFRYRFTDTFVSTGIQIDNRTAKENSLHEIEYLLSADKTETENKLYWKGILNIDLRADIHDLNDKKYESFIKNNLKIIVGGERKYGFGLMELNKINELKNAECSKWNLEIENGGYKFSFNQSTSIVHFVVDCEQINVIKGEMETGMEIMKNTENNLTLTNLRKLYLPGCTCDIVQLELQKGILHFLNQPAENIIIN